MPAGESREDELIVILVLAIGKWERSSVYVQAGKR